MSASTWRTVQGKQRAPNAQHPCTNAGFGAEWGQQRETLRPQPRPRPLRQEILCPPALRLRWGQPQPRPQQEEPLSPQRWQPPRQQEILCSPALRL